MTGESNIQTAGAVVLLEAAAKSLSERRREQIRNLRNSKQDISRSDRKLLRQQHQRRTRELEARELGSSSGSGSASSSGTDSDGSSDEDQVTKVPTAPTSRAPTVSKAPTLAPTLTPTTLAPSATQSTFAPSTEGNLIGSSTTSQSNTTAALSGGVFAGGFVLIVLVAVVLVMFRRKRNEQKQILQGSQIVAMDPSLAGSVSIVGGRPWKAVSESSAL